MNEKQRERIEKHGRDLLAIFPAATEQDPVALCKKLRRLERQGAAVALRLCNGPQYRDGEDDRITDGIVGRVNTLLGNIGTKQPTVSIFCNRDPRGYALKIRTESMDSQRLLLHRDMGGYGILAPEITGD